MKDTALHIPKRTAGQRHGMPSAGRLRCLAVGSGKGGVGKTMLAVGLGCCLARLHYRVLIFDADLGLANVDLQMGLEPACTMQDVLFGNRSLKDAVISSRNGPDVLVAANGAPEMVEMGDARRRMLVKELMQYAGQYDYFIIDVANGIGRNVTTFVQAAPEVMVVVTNEPASVMDAYALIKMLRRAPRPPAMMMVVNMVRSIEEGEDLAAKLNRTTRRFLGVRLPVAGILLQDGVVGDAVRARSPVTQFAPASATARSLERITQFVVHGKGAPRGVRKPQEKFFQNLLSLGLPVH